MTRKTYNDVSLWTTTTAVYVAKHNVFYILRKPVIPTTETNSRKHHSIVNRESPGPVLEILLSGNKVHIFNYRLLETGAEHLVHFQRLRQGQRLLRHQIGGRTKKTHKKKKMRTPNRARAHKK